MQRSRKLFYMLCPLVLAFMPVTSRPADGTADTGPTTVPASGPAGGGARPSTQGTVVLFPATTRRVVGQLRMNFKDATIDSVLEYLADSAGFEVLRTGDVTGRVTIISPQPVNSDEALELLNSALRTQGFTSVQQGRRLKIMTVENAKKSNIPVQFGIDPDKIAENDNFITQVIPVKKVDAVKLKSDLQPLIGTNADLTANQLSNTVIITDTSANVKRMVTIIAAMDKNDPSTVDMKVITLKYADSVTTAKLLTDVFNPSDASKNGQQGGAGANPFDMIRQMRGGGGPGGGGGAGGGGGGSGRGGGGGGDAASEAGKGARVSAVADARTNSIVVTAPEETMTLIDQVIKQLDSDPTSNQTIFTYPLKNGQAVNVAAVLNTLFGNSTSGGTTGTTARAGTSTSSTSGFGSSGSSGTSGLGSTSSSSRSGSSPGTGIGASRTSSTTGGFGSTGGSSGLSSGSQRAASELTGQVYIVANQDTNALLVQCATKYLDQVKKIIDELDRPVAQVLIKVLIAEVTHDESQDAGIDFSVLNENNAGQGVKIGSALGNATGTGGLVVNLIERDFSATIRALATVGKVDVLSRPYILASDNQAANITVGQEVPFITDTRTDALGNQINTIQYQDIGIILDVTPHINPDGLVIMDVAPEISQLSTATVPISSNVNATIINKRSAQTHVAIKDGQTIVIGGLMQDNKNVTITKIPLLGDIPGLGLLFQRRQTDKTKTELLIFITPHVALLPESLKAMSQDEMKGTKLTPNAVDPGTFQDHVRGLQRGTTRPTVDLPSPLLPEPERK